ncbi:MAG: helix-turn-helix domain-containing protein [Succinivibrio sp.]|nr:helix-turn-helix domain-containing protein [Succinivibrio sp.]
MSDDGAQSFGQGHLPGITYAASLLLRLLPVPVVVVGEDDEVLGRFDNTDKSWSVLYSDPELLKRVVTKARESRICLITDELPALIGAVQCARNVVAILGPVCVGRVNQNFVKLYALRHHADNCVLMECDPLRLSSVLLLIHSAVSGEEISPGDFMERYFFNAQSVGRQSEAAVLSQGLMQAKPHNPGIFERQIREAIMRGDEESLARVLDSPYAGMRGTLARDALRNAKNLGIVDVTIATRAAIDAGLSVEDLYTVSDSYILQVENCRYPAEATALARSCAFRCAQEVREYLKRRRHSGNSPAVSKAKEYIERHLHDKISLKELAVRLKISPGHLMRTFKDEEGVTVGDYVRQRKIEAAKLMLQDEQHSIAEIAELLSFNSQSHFGRIFMELTGQSPAKFRRSRAGKGTVDD